MKKLYRFFLSVFIIVLAISFIPTAALVKASPIPINQTVEGEGNHYVTGESFPTNINIVGYDAVANKYYIKFTLTTTKTTHTTVNYYIEIFNDIGTNIEKPGDNDGGDYTNHETGNITTGTFTVERKEIELQGPLTAKYSLIIAVKSVQ